MRKRKNRTENNNSERKISDRVNQQTKSRNYMLGSFFETILTAILDPKDSKAIRIKTDPAYYQNPERWIRIENKNTKRANRVRI